MNKKTILIIDPIHSTAYLSNKLKENNIRTIALFSDMSNIAEFNRPSKQLFDRQIHIKNESIDEIIALISEPVDFVLNGCDQHIHLCEQIANVLTPSLANNDKTSIIRGNKFHQQEAMKNHSFPYIKQVLISRKNPDYDLLKNLTFPVFAKPLNGGGSIGIFKALTIAEFSEKLAQAPEMVNFDPIDYYLVQEYVTGIEIIIDACSYKGIHTFSHVFTYQKNLINGIPVYRTIETLDDITLVNKAIDFAKKVLTACEYENGLSHIELFYTDKGEFRLIELNPRISGASGLPNMMAEAVGFKSQDTLLTEWLTSGQCTSSDFTQRNGFTKALLIYTNEDIDFSVYDSYQTHLTISETPLPSDKTPDLTDLRKIVFLFNKSKNSIEHDADSILNKDLF